MLLVLFAVATLLPQPALLQLKKASQEIAFAPEANLINGVDDIDPTGAAALPGLRLFCLLLVNWGLATAYQAC